MMRDGGPVRWSSSPATLQHLTRVSRLQRLHGHLVSSYPLVRASRFYFDLHSNNDDDELDFFSEKKKKERLQWEGFAEKGFKSGMEERVGDKKLIIITNKCNC